MKTEEEELLIIQIPSLLVEELEGKLKGRTASINRKHIKAKENILAFVSFLSGKAYWNWLEGKHPRIALSSTMLQKACGYDYKKIIEFLET